MQGKRYPFLLFDHFTRNFYQIFKSPGRAGRIFGPGEFWDRVGPARANFAQITNLLGGYQFEGLKH